MFAIVITVLVIYSAAATFSALNLLRKLEVYESTIEEFYSRLSITLHTMRALDEKKMFETDDEVGSVFAQIVDIMGELRPLIYGTPDDKEEN